MHRFTKQFKEYCENKYNLEDSENNNYQSLSVCIIDRVYSLRARYYSVTIPVVDRYAAFYMNGNRNKSGDTVSMLLQHIDEKGGAQKFADKVLENHQRIGGKNSIPKENVCY